jgi:hypothetical protein
MPISAPTAFAAVIAPELAASLGDRTNRFDGHEAGEAIVERLADHRGGQV